MSMIIQRLGHLGDGIADGPVFVPLSLPGEEVAGDVADGRLSVPRILTPSPDRVKPPCAHFKSCGGCALQHASDRFVEAWKANVVVNALAAQGLDAPVRGVQTSSPQSRRRATLSGRRTKKGALVGFHARASGAIIEIPDCKLLHPDIIALIPALQRLVETGASRKAEISISVTLAEGGADIAVTGAKPLDGRLRQDLAEFVQENVIARLSWDGEVEVQKYPPAQTLEGIRLVPPAGAFLQATTEGETALIGAVRDATADARHIADLFAGCGTFALTLAQNAQVHAVESDPDMLQSLDSAWRNAKGLKKITTQARDLFRRPLLPDDLRGFDAVVIDPPRAGAEAQSREIAESGVPLVAMVSCNPVTFARDARLLVTAGFTIDWVDVIDQFRWSPHVELAARFVRA